MDIELISKRVISIDPVGVIEGTVRKNGQRGSHIVVKLDPGTEVYICPKKLQNETVS